MSKTISVLGAALALVFTSSTAFAEVSAAEAAALGRI